MPNQLQALAAVGQSVWLDNIRRSMFASGELQRLIDLGLRGMTSNPTIFEKAIGSGSDYDEQLGELVDETDPQAVFEALAIRDIRSACDLFRDVWESTGGLDGYVSLEVPPTLANDTQGTIDAAQRLWNAVDRPNVMIKIPGTAAGVPAIKASIAAGVNINVTLLFSVDRYENAATAYIEGLEERVARGLPVDRIASVASVFVSRIDNAVDKKVQAKIDAGEHLAPLLGKAAIASTKLTYQCFLKLVGSERFDALRAKGAHVQRPLWASTSTKNPAYLDVKYVEELLGADTINTMPEETIRAYQDHGDPRATLEQGLAQAHEVFEQLERAGVDYHDVTDTLEREGVEKFAGSFDELLSALGAKLQALTPA
jgi:transaldolase